MLIRLKWCKVITRLFFQVCYAIFKINSNLLTLVYNYHHQRGVQISQVSATDRTKREQNYLFIYPLYFLIYLSWCYYFGDIKTIALLSHHSWQLKCFCNRRSNVARQRIANVTPSLVEWIALAKFTDKQRVYMTSHGRDINLSAKESLKLRRGNHTQTK